MVCDSNPAPVDIGQVTYILMFFALTGTIWLGGAGSAIIGGLYWKRGTAAGAWTTLIVGSSLGVLGFIGMNYWASWIYPMLTFAGSACICNKGY